MQNDGYTLRYHRFGSPVAQLFRKDHVRRGCLERGFGRSNLHVVVARKAKGNERAQSSGQADRAAIHGSDGAAKDSYHGALGARRRKSESYLNGGFISG